MELTERDKRAIARAELLVEKINACKQSGIDPYEHPEVRRLLAESADDYPEAAFSLLQRQKAIEIEAAAIIDRWHDKGRGSMADRIESFLELVGKVDRASPDEIKTVTQDPALQNLLLEYLQLDDQIVEILTKEKD